MSTELAFNGVQFEIISRNGQPWVTGRQLAQALGYAREDSVLKIYERNKDEFSSMMSTTVKMTVGITEVMVRIFSMRGCHLVGMFARTPVAKAFRRWVLDVLDRLAEEEREKSFKSVNELSPSLRSELKSLVDAKLSTYPASIQGKARSEIWTRFNRHFRIAEYAQLPAERMPEARDYLIELKPSALKALNCRPIPQLPASESHSSGMFMGFPFTPYELKQLDALADRIEELNGRLHAELGKVYSDILRLLYNYAEGAQVRVFRNLIWARIEEAMVATPSVLKDRMIFSSLNPALMLKMLASGQSCQGE